MDRSSKHHLGELKVSSEFLGKPFIKTVLMVEFRAVIAIYAGKWTCASI
jgi:hypothetical protein